jgi:hypothetical protein
MLQIINYIPGCVQMPQRPYHYCSYSLATYTKHTILRGEILHLDIIRLLLLRLRMSDRGSDDFVAPLFRFMRSPSSCGKE